MLCQRVRSWFCWIKHLYMYPSLPLLHFLFPCASKPDYTLNSICANNSCNRSVRQQELAVIRLWVELLLLLFQLYLEFSGIILTALQRQRAYVAIRQMQEFNLLPCIETHFMWESTWLQLSDWMTEANIRQRFGVCSLKFFVFSLNWRGRYIWTPTPGLNLTLDCLEHNKSCNVS